MVRALFSLLASIVFAGSYTAGFGLTAGVAARRCSGAPRVLFLACLWVGWELARGRLLGGDPWLLLGYALMPAPRLIQIADLGGVYALSFVVAAVNAALAEAALAVPNKSPSVPLFQRGREEKRGGAVSALGTAGGLLALTIAYGTYRLGEPLSGGPALRVAVVQANNDPGRQWRAEFQGEELARYLELSRRAVAEERPDLLVWPESAVTFFPAREQQFTALIAAFQRELGVDLLVGGPHYEGAGDADPQAVRYFNSAFYLKAPGEIAGRYDKSHLLPFAEYFPLRTIELLRRRFERVRSFTPGAEGAVLDTRFGRIAAVICFEGIFPELVRRQMAAGARLLVNLSNDAWLGAGAGPEQHLAMVALRAVEHRTWIVRATTTGVSAIVDPFGRVRARASIGQEATLHDVVRLGPRSTLYQRSGDAFAWLCTLAAAVALALLRRPR